MTTDSANHSYGAHTTKHVDLQRRHTEEDIITRPQNEDSGWSPLTRYVVQWRLEEAIKRWMQADSGISTSCSVLALCAGYGFEGTILMNMGFTDVTVSDLSDSIVDNAKRRDPRLKTLALNAEETGLADKSFDLVIVQDGLHHLPRPVLGFTEMLRIASRAVIFLEPHDSLVGRSIGTDWEVNGLAENNVFRWKKELVESTARSYLGRNAFRNLSFSFWHHNVVFERIGQRLGSRGFSIFCIRSFKTVMDTVLPHSGNQFCGLVVKNQDSANT